MPYNIFLFTIFLSFVTSADKTIKQNREATYYRQDIGLYFQYDKEEMKKEKIPFKENWDFYFSIKNDSVALIQDIIDKTVQKEKEYKISFSVDSVYLRTRSGKKHESKRIYFPSLKLTRIDAPAFVGADK